MEENREDMEKALRLGLERIGPLASTYITPEKARKGYDLFQELKAKSLKELTELVGESKRREFELSRGYFERMIEDARASFKSEPWRRKAYLTVDEATAVLMNLEPRLISFDLIRNSVESVPEARAFTDLHDDIKRAAERGLIGNTEQVIPEKLLDWADKNGIEFPVSLKSTPIQRASARTNKERTTLELLFILAHKGFKYIPEEPFEPDESSGPDLPRQNVAKKIVSHAANLQIEISETTVRTRLREAGNILSDETKKAARKLR